MPPPCASITWPAVSSHGSPAGQSDRRGPRDRQSAAAPAPAPDAQSRAGSTLLRAGPAQQVLCAGTHRAECRECIGRRQVAAEQQPGGQHQSAIDLPPVPMQAGQASQISSARPFPYPYIRTRRPQVHGRATRLLLLSLPLLSASRGAGGTAAARLRRAALQCAARAEDICAREATL